LFACLPRLFVGPSACFDLGEPAFLGFPDPCFRQSLAAGVALFVRESAQDHAAARPRLRFGRCRSGRGSLRGRRDGFSRPRSFLGQGSGQRVRPLARPGNTAPLLLHHDRLGAAA
jgi:hypothetical protein